MYTRNIVFRYALFNFADGFKFHPEMKVFNQSYKQTLGADVYKTKFQIENNEIKVLIWDIEPFERFKHLRSTYYKDVSGILILSSLSHRTDIDKIKNLIHEIIWDHGVLPILIFKTKNPALSSDELNYKELEFDSISIFKIEGDSQEFIEKQIKKSVEKLLQDL
ncbi:hypothetical protein DSAG12_02134 [Promethearchaeum syntrophicum]|uniref:Uncharacterized protein n=1 Tax=Promethearchaeum syntrophicum TaxID=2594042 RepID=A0A5B9DB21_9ARCH|nr:hypothetical protein [Candidatus Prometheoarchaeum syntrophicum]QEE16304.1 Ras family protein [Candidatus Prometheoarchaeum syntrophicum]